MKQLIVFDLDETLIHTAVHDKQEPKDPNVNHSFNLYGQRYDIYVRPGIYKIKQLANQFDLGLFTAAEKKYALQVLNTVDPDLLYLFGNRMKFRKDCTVDPADGLYVKDLRKFVDYGYDVNNILLVDNLHTSYKWQGQCGIPIADFKGTPDIELFKLCDYLSTLNNEEYLSSQSVFSYPKFNSKYK